MALATWWRGDAVPTLSLLAGFRVEASRDEHLIAQINQLAPNEVRQRLHLGHQPYRAYVEPHVALNQLLSGLSFWHTLCYNAYDPFDVLP